VAPPVRAAVVTLVALLKEQSIKLQARPPSARLPPSAGAHCTLS
jgi:hypothetical protein